MVGNAGCEAINSRSQWNFFFQIMTLILHLMGEKNTCFLTLYFSLNCGIFFLLKSKSSHHFYHFIPKATEIAYTSTCVPGSMIPIRP